MSTTIIERNAILKYTCKEMFTLVDDIESYPQFLPWCHASHIISRKSEEVEARLDLVWSGMHKNFTTRNVLTPYERIDILLVEGPFRHLEGIWNFTPTDKEGCKVELRLEFELTGHFFDRFFQPIFHHIANSLVELFSARAREIYGER